MVSRTWRQWRPQFHLRELIGLMLVVALFLGYWGERVARSRAETRLKFLLNVPRVYLAAPTDFQRISHRANISMCGLLVLSDSQATDRLTMRYKLIRASDLQEIATTVGTPSYAAEVKCHSFAVTFPQPLGNPQLEAGTYLVQAECFDGGKGAIAVDVAAIDVVVLESNSPPTTPAAGSSSPID